MPLLDHIVSDAVLERAFAWVSRRRNGYSHNIDVWELRARWAEIKPKLPSGLRAGRCRFTSLRVVRVGGETFEIWSSLDALVLKALTLVLTPVLQPLLSRRCYHLKGHGGAKAAVRAVAAMLPAHQFVFRTDVAGYYASIDHELLYTLLEREIGEKPVLRLLWGYLRRTVCDGGHYREITRGISLGCSLSPLMGALYLQPLDERMEQLGVFYSRFMDDWVVLAPTRWKLRAAIREVNRVMAALNVKQHPRKTTIGRISGGFDFLGYAFSPEGVGVSASSIGRLAAHVTRLYEQQADSVRLGDYVQRWCRWLTAWINGNP